jgi:predicted aminopeptidase
VKQGWGQFKLQWKAVPNDKVLADPKVDEKIKFKLRLIEDAKKFFEHYFAHKGGGIYTKTTFLDSKAVTWLVVASRPDRIEAHEHSFPFMGSFPYLGFFDKEDAEEFAEELKDEGLVTWIRPVFAYSTLGYLEDRVLSSFFEYDEVEIVELVFHEMFHTLFFVKDNVDLNENLANFFADRMLNEYYRDNPTLKLYRKDQESRKVLERKLVAMAMELKSEFAKMRPRLTAEMANAHTERFITEVLVPVVRAACVEQGWLEDDCPDKAHKWNQARLAALLTYEKEQDILTALAGTRTPREFLAQLQQWLALWKKGKQEEDFTSYLKGQLP